MEIVLYTTNEGNAQFRLQKFDEQIWLSQIEMAELYQTTKQNISKHIKAIFSEGELDENSTVNYKLTVQNEGNRPVSRQLAYYCCRIPSSILSWHTIPSMGNRAITRIYGKRFYDR